MFIFLITTGAGGVGINLTAANKWAMSARACKQLSVLLMLHCMPSHCEHQMGGTWHTLAAGQPWNNPAMSPLRLLGAVCSEAALRHSAFPADWSIWTALAAQPPTCRCTLVLKMTLQCRVVIVDPSWSPAADTSSAWWLQVGLTALLHCFSMATLAQCVCQSCVCSAPAPGGQTLSAATLPKWQVW